MCFFAVFILTFSMHFLENSQPHLIGSIKVPKFPEKFTGKCTKINVNQKGKIGDRRRTLLIICLNYVCAFITVAIIKHSF